MSSTTVRFTTYPRTEPPPAFVGEVVTVFRDHEGDIRTKGNADGLRSNQVLATLREDLKGLGFDVEQGKKKENKIKRPVFFGENGSPEVRYEVDAFHPEWRCGLEVEAGRGWMGNAVYRDLILASVMVDVDHFILAVANEYSYKSGDRLANSYDYQKATNLAETIYTHTRLSLPYRLTVIGY